MNHFTHFIVWLLNRWYRAIFAWPIRFNSFYRYKLEDEPIFYTVINICIAFCVILVTGMLGSRIENGHVVIDGMNGILNGELAFFIIYYVYTMLAIQYAKYCSELSDTVRRLKAKEQDW